ncbi:phosphoribosyltransferase, partial [Streptomyces alkaliphilus]
AHAPLVLVAPLPDRVPAPGRPLPQPLHGPAFSSYPAEDVAWLLQDLSEVRLEAPTEEREEAIQSGGAHYAESLPLEYQPDPEYQQLFHDALAASARRVAQAVATVTDTLLVERSRTRPDGTTARPVLASLARAGTPVGVLMRRWARLTHGVDLPHHTLSIVRGRGIDTTALRWLAAHHDPADVVFVDGWTGKGAITRELAEALDTLPGPLRGAFCADLAVLADPGSCVSVFGTRDDFLIPSACLNSTVSGLVSRTVLRADLIGPDEFHGAKHYRELADADLSETFLAAVEAHFPEVTPGPMDPSVDRTPTMAGWRAVERIGEEYGIADVNLIKPGVGETTRVLLRRVPWRIVARRDAGPDLDHIRLLADRRGVPIEEVDDLPYRCLGLIHPQYTRGATGADGKAAR